MITVDTRPMRTSATQPIEDDSANVDWTIALAGGEGVRLAQYVERRFGRRIPKQYCCLLGNRSMLEHTLERLNKLTPASRTFTVIGTHHGDIAYPQLAGKSDHVLRQPSARDTGLALYVALAYLKRWTPNALVTITPTDHYVAPSARYIEQVRAARGVAAQMRDMVFAWTVAKHVKSNAIVYAKDGATVGIGAGQMSRVDSTRIAARKSADMAEVLELSEAPVKGAVVASDAFFPFPDGLLTAAEAGAVAVIQPGGSVRDDEVIAAADAAGLSMVFTGVRHFRH